MENNRNSTETRTVVLDTKAPALVVSSPTNTTYKNWYNYTIPLRLTSSDAGVGIQKYWYSLNNGTTNTTFTPNTTITASAGTNRIWVWVNDSVNNVNRTDISFYLEFSPTIGMINISNVYVFEGWICYII